MIDIATTTPPNAASFSILAVPFDWVLLSAPAANQPWHDNTNLCDASKDYIDALPNTYVFALEAGLHTAVTHSLFTDARAGRDDKIPYNSTDKRGWLGEFYLSPEAKKYGAYGSKLWLHYYTSATDDVPEAQRFAAQESLAWLIGTGIVDVIDVTAEYVHKEGSELLALHIVMSRDGENEPVYDAVWGATLNNPEGQYAAA